MAVGDIIRQDLEPGQQIALQVWKACKFTFSTLPPAYNCVLSLLNPSLIFSAGR